MKKSTKVILGICGVIAILLATVSLFGTGVVNEVAGIDPPILPW